MILTSYRFSDYEIKLFESIVASKLGQDSSKFYDLFLSVFGLFLDPYSLVTDLSGREEHYWEKYMAINEFVSCPFFKDSVGKKSPEEFLKAFVGLLKEALGSYKPSNSIANSLSKIVKDSQPEQSSYEEKDGGSQSQNQGQGQGQNQGQSQNQGKSRKKSEVSRKSQPLRTFDVTANLLSYMADFSYAKAVIEEEVRNNRRLEKTFAKHSSWFSVASCLRQLPPAFIRLWARHSHKLAHQHGRSIKTELVGEYRTVVGYSGDLAHIQDADLSFFCLDFINQAELLVKEQMPVSQILPYRAAAPCVFVVLDVSGSMSDAIQNPNPFLVQMVGGSIVSLRDIGCAITVSVFQKVKNAGGKFGLVLFSEKAYVFNKIETVSDIISEVYSDDYPIGTNFTNALSGTCSVVEQIKTDSDFEKCAGLFITDGIDPAVVSCSKAKEHLAYLVQNARMQGIFLSEQPGVKLVFQFFNSYFPVDYLTDIDAAKWNQVVESLVI